MTIRSVFVAALALLVACGGAAPQEAATPELRGWDGEPANDNPNPVPEPIATVPEESPSSLPLLAEDSATTTANTVGPFAPRGTVIDQNGDPLPANVYLLYSAAPEGPSEWVPDGSVLMSSENRSNPVTLEPDGVFGWGVLPGYYQVRADLHGCHAPGDESSPEVETEVLEIPPGRPDIVLQLDCTQPTESTLTLETWILDGVDVPGEMVVEVVCELDGATTTSGPHAVAMNGDVEIKGLPVGSDCDIAVVSLPDTVIQDVTMFDATIGQHDNLIVLYLSTGITPDDLLVEFRLVPGTEASPDAEARVVAECSDGSVFDTTMDVDDRVLLTPIALGAECVVTLSSRDVEIIEPTQTTMVFSFYTGHERSEDERANWECGDLTFRAR